MYTKVLEDIKNYSLQNIWYNIIWHDATWYEIMLAKLSIKPSKLNIYYYILIILKQSWNKYWFLRTYGSSQNIFCVWTIVEKRSQLINNWEVFLNNNTTTELSAYALTQTYASWEQEAVPCLQK